MTKAEREKLMEEKNIVVGQKKESRLDNSPAKRKIFFNSKSNGQDRKEENESNLTEADRGLLKVFYHTFLHKSDIILGEIFRNC